jgi:hypothetical protein
MRRFALGHLYVDLGTRLQEFRAGLGLDFGPMLLEDDQRMGMMAWGHRMGILENDPRIAMIGWGPGMLGRHMPARRHFGRRQLAIGWP